MIDILLATYNGEKFLKEQIESILSQTCGNWKLLIRDDGSNDNTIDIINAFSQRYPDKIELIKDADGNIGPAQNFSRLLQNSTGQYVMFCDQDDVWLPKKIETTLNKIKETENIYPNIPLLVHTDLKVVDADLNTIAESFWSYNKIDPERDSIPERIIYRNTVTGCTAMINKKAKQIAAPIPKFVRLHDWWIALNVAKYGRIFYISEPAVLYRQHRENVIGAASKPLLRSLFGKLTTFPRRFINDYKTIKQIFPKANPVIILLKNIQISIFRRI